MYSGGLRVSEVCSLTINDINETDMLINIENGKGGYKRQTVLSKKALNMLKNYLKINPSRHRIFPAGRKHVQSGFLFNIPDQGKPLSGRSVQRRKKAGSRHTCLRLHTVPCVLISKENLFWQGIKIVFEIKDFRSIKNNTLAMNFRSFKPFSEKQYRGFS